MADAQDLGSCTERCRGSTPLSCILIIAIAPLLWLQTIASGDTLWVGGGSGGGGGGAIQVSNAKIIGIEKDQIIFMTGGTQTSRELSKVQRLNVDGEPALNQAEDAFAAGRWDQAVDAYQTLLRATSKVWIKDWTAPRLAEAASKSRRFDAAATAYVALVLKDPAAAARAKPPVPDGKSAYVDSAVGAVNAALSTAGITDEQRVALLNFLVEIHRARKDAAAEASATNKLNELLAKNPANPVAGQALARRVLQSAQRALDAKDFQKAIGEIELNRGAFADPAEQADALWIVAEARNGLAQAAGGKDSNALKDAALAYMRIVAHFSELPNKPHVAAALLKTAAIEEQLGEKAQALGLYQQVAAQFPDDPIAAPTAKQSVDRLAAK